MFVYFGSLLIVMFVIVLGLGVKEEMDAYKKKHGDNKDKHRKN